MAGSMTTFAHVHPHDDLLVCTLSHCPASFLLCVAARVCWRWARLVEELLRQRCDLHGWRPARSGRLRSSCSPLVLSLVWRSVFRARACRACYDAVGDFAVRDNGGRGHAECLLCALCAKAKAVPLLQRRGLSLDVTGLSGKPLYSAKGDRFCAEVSRLSKASLEHASGERAERLRQARRGGEAVAPS